MEGSIFISDLDKANALNEYSPVASILLFHHWIWKNAWEDHFKPVPIWLINDKVHDLLCSFDSTKTSGCDYISAQMLNSCASNTCHTTHVLFNLSVMTGKIPDAWSHVTLITISFSPRNYRPISLHAIQFLTTLPLVILYQAAPMEISSTTTAQFNPHVVHSYWQLIQQNISALSPLHKEWHWSPWRCAEIWEFVINIGLPRYDFWSKSRKQLYISE